MWDSDFPVECESDQRNMSTIGQHFDEATIRTRCRSFYEAVLLAVLRVRASVRLSRMSVLPVRAQKSITKSAEKPRFA